MEERERRKQIREQDLNRRRSLGGIQCNGSSDCQVQDDDDDEEADRKAQADDEEVSRRFTIRVSCL